MSAMVNRTPQAKTLYIGEGVTIKAAVLVCDTVMVDGVLDGDISVDNLIIGKTGSVSGRIKVVRNADIAGRVCDKLDVKGLLVLRAGGRIEGSMSFGTLTMERGASITGEVSSTDYRNNMQSSYRAQQQPAAAVAAPARQPDVRPSEVVRASEVARASEAARPNEPARASEAPAAVKRLDLTALDLMPGPIAAIG